MLQQEQPSINIQHIIEAYLSTEDSNKKKQHLNQILNAVSQHNIQTLNKIMEILPFDTKQQSDRTKTSQLLFQIVKRKKQLKIPADQNSEIMSILKQKVLNLSTTSYTLKTILELSKRYTNESIFTSIFQLLNNPKFHPQSHRQEIRLISYQLLELLTQYPQYLTTSVLQTKFISMVIDSTYQQRDPRNIGKMFILYYWVLNNLDDNLLAPYRNSMFSNLQAYYPIDYIGDEDDGITITIQELNSELDKSITLPIFKQNCLELLQSKTASPPILQFLPTICKYIQNNPDMVSKLEILMKRFIQQQFLEDPTSYLLISECFRCWFKYSAVDLYSVSIRSYEYLVNVLDLAIKVLPTKSAFVIQLVKSLSTLKSIQTIVAHYVIQHIITNYKMYNSGNLGYLLGLVVIIEATIKDQQLLNLFHLSLIEIFIMQPIHIQILVLKIFMILKKNHNKLNSLESILKQLLFLLKNQKQQSILRKSVIEFVKEAGDKIIKFQTAEYIETIYQSIEQQSYSNLEIMVFYLLLDNPKKLSQLLVKESELADSIIDQIEENIMKTTPQQKSKILLELNHQILDTKYVKRIKAILGKIIKDQEIKHLITDKIKSVNNAGIKFVEIFYVVLRHTNPELIKSHQSMNNQNLKIRQLNSQSLKVLEQSLDKNLLRSVCRVSPEDYPTFRQYLFETIYPLVKQKSADPQYKYILFLILEETPSSLLQSNIEQITSMIMNQIEVWTEEIASVSLNILNIYFDIIDEEKYNKLVSVCCKLLESSNGANIRLLSNISQIFGRISEKGGQIRFKTSILESLEPLLNHQKRIVRKTAAYSYNKWFFM